MDRSEFDASNTRIRALVNSKVNSAIDGLCRSRDEASYIDPFLAEILTEEGLVRPAGQMHDNTPLYALTSRGREYSENICPQSTRESRGGD